MGTFSLIKKQQQPRVHLHNDDKPTAGLGQLTWIQGLVVARTFLKAALDSADLATRTMATAIAMRRSSWLQVSGLPPEVQNTVWDLPFDCSGLSSEQTDFRFHSLKDSRATLESLGIHVPAPQRKLFKVRPTPCFYSAPPRTIIGNRAGVTGGAHLCPPQASKPNF